MTYIHLHWSEKAQNLAYPQVINASASNGDVTLKGQGQCQGHYTSWECPKVRCMSCKNLVTLALIIKNTEAKVDF